jgi:hypothetical protein
MFSYDLTINSIVVTLISGYISTKACLFSSKSVGQISFSNIYFVSSYCSGCISVLSSFSSLSGTLKNPAACSYILSDSCFFKSALDLYGL